MRISRTRSTSSLIATLALLFGLTISAASSASAEGRDYAQELSAVATANAAGTDTWGVNLRAGWDTKRLFKVVGAGKMPSDRVRLTVTPSNSVSWMIGERQLAAILMKPSYRPAIKNTPLSKAKYVELDSYQPTHMLAQNFYAVDNTVRPSAVATWLAANGSVTRAVNGNTKIYAAQLDPNVSLPTGIGALFFPDREHPIEVSVTLRNNKIQGYTFLVRAELGPRTLEGFAVTAPAKLPAPSTTEITTASMFATTLEQADAPRNLLPAILKRTKPGTDLGPFRAVLQKAVAYTDIDVAPTATGVVVYPGYPLSAARQLDDARCLDRDSNWAIRPCTEQDDAVLPSKFAGYANAVNAFLAYETVTPALEAEFFQNLGHQMYLYDNPQEHTIDDLASWRWFLIETYQRSRATR